MSIAIITSSNQWQDYYNWQLIAQGKLTTHTKKRFNHKKLHFGAFLNYVIENTDFNFVLNIKLIPVKLNLLKDSVRICSELYFTFSISEF